MPQIQEKRYIMSKTLLLIFSLLFCVMPACTPGAYQPTTANLEARQWFQDAKFGLFIHWGVYSTLANGEWVMQNARIPVTEYEKLAAEFNPTEFDAAAWVALAKAAGAHYITITSKHHDGFAMFDSKVSTWDIVERTPYGKDPLKLLADECHKQGIKLFFYYSQLDWHHPNYFPRGKTGQFTGRAESGHWHRYLDFMDAQLKELLTNYGDIGGIWFDGWWDKPEADWKLERTYRMIHRLQPQTLIGSNHHRAPFDGEDFQMFEKDLPGENTAGFNQDASIGSLPLETCETINTSWGYNKADGKFKSARELIHYLVRAAGRNANFLLNVGPMPNGNIQPEFTTRLKELGDWLKQNGEAIYTTRGGPVAPQTWGVTTQKGNTIYIHILRDLSAPLQTVSLPLTGRVVSAKYLNDSQAVQFDRIAEGIQLKKLRQPKADEYDTIIVLELAKE